MESITTTTIYVGGDLDTIESIYDNVVPIPGSIFEMGCSPGDSDCYDGELPRHTVAISAFKMSAYEITQGQWEAVMGEKPSWFDECGSDCPVEDVSWYEMQDFIEELNSQTGKNYRLPTEAEWEYAARAGSTTKWYCGNDEDCVTDIAWYGDNSGMKTHPVGQKQPNTWGLFDMTGNVWEWVQDWFDLDYYSSSPSTDPQGPDVISIHTVRGGGWDADDLYCRSSVRGGYSPSLPDSQSSLGFRLCLPQ